MRGVRLGRGQGRGQDSAGHSGAFESAVGAWQPAEVDSRQPHACLSSLGFQPSWGLAPRLAQWWRLLGCPSSFSGHHAQTMWAPRPVCHA